MKKWKLQFTQESVRLLSKLHPENKKQIKQTLIEVQKNPHTGKNLQEELWGFKSLRITKYRVIYMIGDEDNNIEIYFVGRRNDVYEQFRRLLTDLQRKSE